MNQHSIEKIFEYFDQYKNIILKEFFDLLSIPSISTLEEHKTDIKNTVLWLENKLKNIGLDVSIIETERHPVILASYLKAGANKPTLLFYNHYDVQPVDPIDLWESPPFSPVIKNENVYARGAQDNKGQLWCLISAIEYLLKTNGKLPINIKMLIEGEEEIGSLNLPQTLNQHKPLFKADHLAILDCCIPSINTPAITLGLRGFLSIEITIFEAKFDLHSGAHGGLAYNPNQALAEILASLKNENGRVTVPGFYDEVISIPKEDLEKISFEFDSNEFYNTFGYHPNTIDNLSPNESRWLEPSLDINGMWGGYTGEGIKTIIPSKASAKLTCRLIPDQTPEHISKCLKDYFNSACPHGLKIEVIISKSQSKAIRTPINVPVISAAAQAIEDVWETKATFILEGWSVPIVPLLKEISGAEVVLFGFGLASDAIHAPNEHFSLNRLKLGFATLVQFIKKIDTP